MTLAWVSGLLTHPEVVDLGPPPPLLQKVMFVCVVWTKYRRGVIPSYEYS